MPRGLFTWKEEDLRRQIIIAPYEGPGGKRA